MVSIPEIKALGDILKTNDQSIEHFVMAVSEDHAYIKLGDKTGVCLMLLYPSADREGKQNEAIDANTTWLFVLEKNIDGQTDQQEAEQYERLRKITVKALEFIEEESVNCSLPFLFLNRHQPGRTQIIPEFAEFGGFNGWSMSLVF